MMTIQTGNTEVSGNTNAGWTGRGANFFLWTLQALLAGLFLFAGVMKFVMSVEAMTKDFPLPGWFLHFIGIAEILGALGLVLPWLLKIKRVLTPLAASGLVVIMIGATIITLKTGGIGQAWIPFTVGVLLVLIARGRWIALKQMARHQTSDSTATLSALG
jgi:uncharacterized membrane protein YphA (DoxX/SURF4 family)